MGIFAQPIFASSLQAMSHAPSDQEVLASGYLRGLVRRLVRREALQKLRALGIEPFPAAEFPVTSNAREVKGLFKEEGEPAQVTIAGRLMSVRVMGKASFAVLRDHTGDQQIYVARDEVAPGEDKTLYDEVWKHLLHLGDFIGVEGHVFRTRTGEITVHVKKLTVLGKALRPLPVVKTDEDGNVHDAFTDPEQRYRMRYVDLNVNPGVRETFLKRSRIVSAMRATMTDAGYHEVDTPVLQPIPGGAAARPFETHHNALDTRALPAHRQRALPEAPDRGRLRGRVRVQPQLPQRGHGPHAQPGVHHYGTLRGLQGLPLDDGLHGAHAGAGVHRRQRIILRTFKANTHPLHRAVQAHHHVRVDPGKDRRRTCWKWMSQRSARFVQERHPC
jgi:hypothetical protein